MDSARRINPEPLLSSSAANPSGDNLAASLVRDKAYVDKAGGNNGGNACMDTFCKIVHCSHAFTMLVATMMPSIFSPEYKLGFLVGTLVCVWSIFENLFLYWMKKTRVFPKYMDVTLLLTMASLTIVAWTQENISNWLMVHFMLILWASIFVESSILWMLGYPYGKAAMADEVDDSGLTHPCVCHYIRMTTGAFVLLWFLSTVAVIPAAVYWEMGMRGDMAKFKQAANVVQIGVYVNIGLGVISGIWMAWYARHFWKNIDKIAAKYEEEIKEWEEQHPDHAMAQDDYIESRNN